MKDQRSHPEAEFGGYASLPLLDALSAHPGDLLARAEAAERRLAFLSEVSSVLGSSLDYETTLADLARLAVSFLADWCIVYLLDGEAHTRRVAVTHADPANAYLAEELRRCMTPAPTGTHPAMEAVRSGRPIMLPILTDSVLQFIARDERHLGTLRRMRLRSSICTPLTVQGRIVGSLLFMTAESGRMYGEEDLRLAEDLAARAALAVENARLYQEAQSARSTVEDLNSRLQRSMVETHHRVKNNLQIIAAMIDARLMDDHDPVTEQDLYRLASNVRALSSVHDALTHRAQEQGNTERVSARDVLGRLIPLIQQTAAAHALTFDVDDAFLTVRQSTALALVVNELVSNAVKHGRQGVEVTLRVRGLECTMSVLDDGAGFPPDFDLARDANTGLALVETLSRWDLAGGAEFSNRPEGGGAARVTFPLSSSTP